MKTVSRAALAIATAAVMYLSALFPAYAQQRTAHHPPQQLAASAPAPAQGYTGAETSNYGPPQQSSAYPAGQSEDVVFLAEWIKRCPATAKPGECDTPRAARPSSIGPDTPVMSRARFVEWYPQAGNAGYEFIKAANRSLCDEVQMYMAYLQNLDKLFVISENEYQTLSMIYNDLPGDVKRATIVTTIAQAGVTGALCLLSAGLYCIAAAVGAAGNIFSAFTNKNMQMAHIKLSIANIAVTRLNIMSNRITLRLDGMWLKFIAPACQKIGYNTLSGLSDLGPIPVTPADFPSASVSDGLF